MPRRTRIFGGPCVVVSRSCVPFPRIRYHNCVNVWLIIFIGSNNFGLVTRFDLRTFEQGPFWGGAVFYFAPSFPSQIEALVQELKRLKSNQTHLMVNIGYSVQFAQLGGTLCMNQLYDAGTIERSPALEPFATVSPQIDQLNSMRVLTLKEAASEKSQQSADDIRCAYMNATVKPDVEKLRLAADEYTSAMESLKSVEGLTYSSTLQPYPVSLMEKSEALGGNIFGLDASQGPLVFVLALTWWKNKQDDEKIISTFKGVLDKVDQIAAEKGTASPYKYLNYAWTSQEPIKSYGAENVDFLKRASQEYDPNGLFQKGVPGGFKLFD